MKTVQCKCCQTEYPEFELHTPNALSVPTLWDFKASDRTLWKKAFYKKGIPYKINVKICRRCRDVIDDYRDIAGEEANKNNPQFRAWKHRGLTPLEWWMNSVG
jgi:hypothetical protein